MKLFEIINDYIGANYVHVLCVAETEDEAIKMAWKKFKTEAENFHYPSDYYSFLKVRLLCPDLSGGFCTDIYN